MAQADIVNLSTKPDGTFNWGNAMRGAMSTIAAAELEKTTFLLSFKQFEPSATTDFTTSSTTFVDVDATEMIWPQFVAPASGVVLVKANLLAWPSNTASSIRVNIRTSSGDVAGTAAVLGRYNAETRYQYVKRVAVTPGSTINWRLGFAITSASHTATIRTNSFNGPALFEVWSLPSGF
jgi:hypothetical protein